MFNQIKIVSTVILCTLQSYVVQVLKVQCHYSWAKKCETRLLYTSCQGRNLFSTVSHFEFAFSSNSSSNFWSFRRFRLGKEIRDALEKSLSMGAEDGRVAFSSRKRSLTDGKPLRLSTEFEHGSPRYRRHSIVMQFSEFKVFWKCILH